LFEKLVFGEYCLLLVSQAIEKLQAGALATDAVAAALVELEVFLFSFIFSNLLVHLHSLFLNGIEVVS
jgi:hypothetical protein